MRIAGILPIVFYAIHAAVHLHRGQPYDLLWGCHIAVLLVGFGWILRNPTLNAIGFLWSCVGLPLWILDVATGGTFLPTSTLTHVGAFAFGYIGVRKLGMPRYASIKALASFVMLWTVCRVVTPPAANINLAVRVHDGWEPYFSSYALYFAMLLVIAAAIFSIVERAA
ncbi:MAG: hypothetical protein ACJ74H_07225 [Thermoanaerobaculia bacterium]